MDATHRARFYLALDTMGEVFDLPPSKQKKLAYWRLLSHRASIEEFEYACEQAMLKETFVHFPIPGQLMDYVYEHRRARRQERLKAEPSRQLAERDDAFHLVQVRTLIEQVLPGYRTEPHDDQDHPGAAD